MVISTNTGVVGESVEITYIFKYYTNLLLTGRLVVESNVFDVKQIPVLTFSQIITFNFRLSYLSPMLIYKFNYLTIKY